MLFDLCLKLDPFAHYILNTSHDNRLLPFYSDSYDFDDVMKV